MKRYVYILWIVPPLVLAVILDRIGTPLLRRFDARAAFVRRSRGDAARDKMRAIFARAGGVRECALSMSGFSSREQEWLR